MNILGGYCVGCGNQIERYQMIKVDHNFPQVKKLSPCCDAELTELNEGIEGFKCQNCGKITKGAFYCHFVWDYENCKHGYLIKTPCCKADVIRPIDAKHDYFEYRKPEGQRFASPNFSAVVKLCIAIGKSPYSIRQDSGGYYIDIKSKAFIKRIEQVFKPLIKASNL